MKHSIIIAFFSLIILIPSDIFADNNAITSEESYIFGTLSMKAGAWDKAAYSFQKASGYEPLADYALFYLGEALFNKEDYQAALYIFKTLAARFPETRWKEEAGFKAADSLLRFGRYGEAWFSFGRFARDNPSSNLIPKARVKMAESLEKEGKLSEAYNSYKALWIKYPSSIESRTASARMTEISSRKDIKGSIQPPSIDERYERVSALLSGGDYKGGITELLSLLKEVEKEGIERPGWFGDAQLKLAEAYYQTREEDKAVAVLKKFIETSSSKATGDALFLYGKALQRSDKRAEAVKVFEGIIKDHPKKDIAVNALFRVADMAEGDGDLARAGNLYRNLYTAFPESSLADDAIWKEGWLSYLRKDYKQAYLLFGKLLADYPLSEFADTALYWSARAAEKGGMTEDAAAHYVNIINKFPLSYYAVISKGRLSSVAQGNALSGRVKRASLISTDKRQMPDKYVSFHLAKGKALLNMGFNEDASMEFSLAESRCNDRMTALEIAGLLSQAGDYHRAQRVALKNFQEALKEDAGRFDSGIWAFAFPTGFSEDVDISAERNSLSPYLIHAIIREESSYRPDAVSRAGAIGLMQVMPSTGSNMSKEAGFKDYGTQTLYRPGANITIGSLYMKKLIEANKGNIPLAIASYNAGPNAVMSWISKYGTEEMDEFIERIPYSETRNYVKRVLRSYEIYGRLYSVPKIEASERVAIK